MSCFFVFVCLFVLWSSVYSAGKPLVKVMPLPQTPPSNDGIIGRSCHSCIKASRLSFRGVIAFGEVTGIDAA